MTPQGSAHPRPASPDDRPQPLERVTTQRITTCGSLVLNTLQPLLQLPLVVRRLLNSLHK